MKQVQAKDLRIGNTIQWLHEEHETFHNVDIEIISQIDKYNKDPYDDIFSRGFWFAPIDLTPEILEKCGFEPWMDVDENEMMRREDFSIEWMEFLSIDSGYYFNWQSPKETKVTYLHELQNLYFALTKEELEFKP